MNVFRGNKIEKKLRYVFSDKTTISINPLTGIPDHVMNINVIPRTLKNRAVALTEEKIDVVFKEFLKEYEDTFRVNPEDLELESVKKIRGKWYVKYSQFYKGIPVLNSAVSLDSLENGQICSYVSNFKTDIAISTTPGLSLDQATVIAQKTYTRKFTSSLSPSAALLVIYSEKADKKNRYNLAWKFLLSPPDPDPELEKYFIIDAFDGRVIKSYTARFPGAQIYGNIRGNIYPSNPTDTVISRPYRNQYVRLTRPFFQIDLRDTTDREGHYSLSLPWYYFLVWRWTVRFFLEGPHVRVQNNSGSDYVRIRFGRNNSRLDYAWTDADGDHINLFYHMNLFHDWLQHQLDHNWKNLWDGSSRMNAEVNHSFNNAYAGDPMKFGTSSFARSSSVVYHECMHNVLASIYGDYIGWPERHSEGYAMDEGFADYFACSCNNHSVMGEDVLSSPRDLDNNAQYSGKESYNLGGHTGGLIIGGAAWDLRQQLAAAEGEAGSVVADRLLLDAHEILSSYPQDFYFSDPHESNFLLALYKAADDNNNLQDGFPYFDDIQNAFFNHNLLQAVLYDKDSYDFSSNLTGFLAGGDLYYTDGHFWSNNEGQRGVQSLGDTGSNSIAELTIPHSGYTRSGVEAIVGHTYSAIAADGEDNKEFILNKKGYIVFRVEALSSDKSTITLQYLYRYKYLIFLPDDYILDFYNPDRAFQIGRIINLQQRFIRAVQNQTALVGTKKLNSNTWEECTIPIDGNKQDKISIVVGDCYVSEHADDKKNERVIFKVNSIKNKTIHVELCSKNTDP